MLQCNNLKSGHIAFPVHYSLIIQSFDGIQVEQLEASLNKLQQIDKNKQIKKLSVITPTACSGEGAHIQRTVIPRLRKEIPR
jgi:hypothetical protein